jgi:purine-binding chemotaxis protein CheW
VLVVRAHGLTAAVPLGQVVEVMRPLPTDALAGAPPFVRGIALIRGSPVPVVELGRLLGAERDAEVTRYVVVRIGARRVALGVDDVPGIREVEEDTLHALPPLLRQASADAVAQVGRLDAELLVLLHTGRLVPEDLWAVPTAGEGPA